MLRQCLDLGQTYRLDPVLMLISKFERWEEDTLISFLEGSWSRKIVKWQKLPKINIRCFKKSSLYRTINAQGLLRHLANYFFWWREFSRPQTQNNRGFHRETDLQSQHCTFVGVGFHRGSAVTMGLKPTLRDTSPQPPKVRVFLIQYLIFSQSWHWTTLINMIMWSWMCVTDTE